MNARKHLLLVILTIGCLAAATAAAEEFKVGLVDLDQAINSTDQGKAAREELSRKQRDAEGQLKPLVDKGKALQEELKSKRFVLSADALRQKELDMVEIQVQLRNKQQELEGQFKVDYERLVGPLRTKLLGIVEDIGKKQGFSMILERGTRGMLYAREALDITDLVIQEFNKKG